jgi:hypothetical protein
MPDGALTPDLALSELGGLSTDIRAGVVLARTGELLAGAEALVAPARALLAAADADLVEVDTMRGTVVAARSGHHAIAVVVGRFALPALVRYDVRRVLAGLDGSAPPAQAAA